MAHVMTPARRAALRKAQLASAAKRRRGGVGSAARRAVGQKAGYAKASTQVAVRRHVGSKGFQKKAKTAAKYTAIGLGAAAVVGGAYKAAEVSSRAKSTGSTPKQVLKNRSNSRKSNKNTRTNLMSHNKYARKSGNINRKTYRGNRKAINKAYSYRRRF